MATWRTCTFAPSPGRAVPISEVAEISFGIGHAGISRIDRQRAVNVQAIADKDIASPTEINEAIYPMNPYQKRIYPTDGSGG